MNTKLFTTLAVTATVLLSAQVPARAVGFSFTSNITQANGAKGDITLNSVTHGGETTAATNLTYVKAVDIIQNTKIDPTKGTSVNSNNTGAASTDKGDLASSPMETSGVKDPTGSDMAAYLGNNNLNNIIDTEDAGQFTLNLWFANAVSNVFLWERGMNSKLSVQALSSTGAVIGNLLKLSSSGWQNAGYSIDTTEIGGSQNVGSIGLGLADLGVAGPIAGIQLITNGLKGDNGPDFKVIGGAEAVPEPFTMTGVALGVGGMIVARRRRMSKTA